jgi:RNA methyltransferase, TrmH family
MLSKSKISFIKSLQVKKYRQEEQCFLIHGAKTVDETLASDFEILTLLGTEDFLKSIEGTIIGKVKEIIEVSEKELTSVGSVETNNSALAVVKMPEQKAPRLLPTEFYLLLDDIRDPGNLGTIIRTAEWFGINTIIASAETTDVYNPKVISATMGSFLRVNMFYTSLTEFLSDTSMPVYGTFLKGENIHDVKFQKGGMIVIGNESKGISPGVEKFVTNRITIPRFGNAESLNASTATAIVLDNLRR